MFPRVVRDKWVLFLMEFLFILMVITHALQIKMPDGNHFAKFHEMEGTDLLISKQIYLNVGP